MILGVGQMAEAKESLSFNLIEKIRQDKGDKKEMKIKFRMCV